MRPQETTAHELFRARQRLGLRGKAKRFTALAPALPFAPE
jgi:hypothetical protein